MSISGGNVPAIGRTMHAVCLDDCVRDDTMLLELSTLATYVCVLLQVWSVQHVLVRLMKRCIILCRCVGDDLSRDGSSSRLKRHAFTVSDSSIWQTGSRFAMRTA